MVRPTPTSKIENKTADKKKTEVDLSNAEEAWALALKVYPELELEKVRKTIAACGSDIETNFIKTLEKNKLFPESIDLAKKLISELFKNKLKAPKNVTELVFYSMNNHPQFSVEFIPMLRSLGIKSTEAILKSISNQHLDFSKLAFEKFGYRNCLPEGVLSFTEEKQKEKKEQDKKKRELRALKRKELLLKKEKEKEKQEEKRLNEELAKMELLCLDEKRLQKEQAEEKLQRLHEIRRKKEIEEEERENEEIIKTAKQKKKRQLRQAQFTFTKALFMLIFIIVILRLLVSF